jgi:hypothetical protein
MSLLDIVNAKLVQIASYHDASITYIRERIDGLLDAEEVESLEGLSTDSLALVDRLLDCEMNDHDECGGRKRNRTMAQHSQTTSLLHPVSILSTKLTRLLSISPDDFRRVEKLCDVCLTSKGGQAALSASDEEFAASQLTEAERKEATRLPGGCVALLTAKRQHEATLVAAENEAKIPATKLALLRILVGDDPVAIRNKWTATQGIGLAAEAMSQRTDAAVGTVPHAAPVMPLPMSNDDHHMALAAECDRLLRKG